MYRLLLLCSVAVLASAQSFETRALEISRIIQERHLPFGTILSPVHASPESTQIVSYSRCGDSAIWTGHYLAAEAFRYAVTRSPEALLAARAALRGIHSLVAVTGQNRVLARCVLRPNSPFAADPRNEEKEHGEHRGTFNGLEYIWIGNTSRDQYMGAFFGLSVAYEHMPEDRALIREIATPLIDRLLEKNWSVVMPDGSSSTVFWLRPDQQLAILQVGRQINPERFRADYETLRSSARAIGLPIQLESLDEHGSYFKFNLDAITLYTLLRLEEESPRRGDYIAVYRTFRSIVRDHGNAFFNVIDRALVGVEAQRDAETARLMAQWLQRPTRDVWVDLRGKYKACDNDRACQVIPVSERVRTDFVWQRSPFLLYGGGSGRIESPGIDFILPYWMARHYGIDFAPTVASAASGTAVIAPDSLASLFGAGMPALNARVSVIDSAGVAREASVFFSNSEQINFAIPPGLAMGPARIVVRDAAGIVTSTSSTTLQRVAPALFTANGSGSGPVSALAIRVERDGSHMSVPVAQCPGNIPSALCFTTRIEVSDDRPVYLSLYGTGIRAASSPAAVQVTIDNITVPVLYAGPQAQFAGLDQINVRLLSSLRGKGEVDLVLTADGIASNTVRIGIR
jgi:uncharacterized protein (TIGR03437 family)